MMVSLRSITCMNGNTSNSIAILVVRTRFMHYLDYIKIPAEHSLLLMPQLPRLDSSINACIEEPQELKPTFVQLFYSPTGLSISYKSIDP